MQNTYHPSSTVDFIADFLIGAAYAHPIILLSPPAFAALWLLWCALKGRRTLLTKGLLGIGVMFAGSLISAGLLLLFALSALGGASVGAGMEMLSVLLLVFAVVMYYGIIPFLLLITVKWRRTGG